MAVLINGIEMPKGANEHRLIIRANGQVIIDKKTYWEEAKAVPVPPHGRLIDADAAVANRNADMNWCYDLNDLPDYLSDCPTIIPASEEGE